MNKKQQELAYREIKVMLRKEQIVPTQNTPGEFISNLFLVEKKDGGQRPVINLKNLNNHVPYKHFKMEGLQLISHMLRKGDFMCKLDLKDAYFCLPLHKESYPFVKFQWDGKLYQFTCLCFGLGPAPRTFTKLLKVPIGVLRRLNMLIIIYIDDMLIIGRTQKEAEISRDTVIYLLQHLGFLFNMKKSVFTPCQEIKFLGLTINSLTMSLSLDKIRNVQKHCQEMYKKSTTSILELTKLLSLLSSTIQAIVSAWLQSHNLQQLQIQNLRLNRSYQIEISLTPLAKEELLWWIENLTHSNGKSLVHHQVSQILIQTDASMKGWGAVCKGVQTEGCFRVDSSKISSTFISQNVRLKFETLPNRQQDCSIISGENGRNL